MSDAIEAEAIAWFARMHSDVRTRADEDRFEQWLKQDPRHELIYARIASLWRKAGPEINPRLLSGDDRTAPRSPRKSARIALAAMFVAAVAGAVLFLAMHKGLVTEGSFVTAAGAQRRIDLSDGSSITLNTRSEVSVDLAGQYRMVRLIRGEARFNVAKDAARPFIVDTGSARVRALGTSFDVRVSDVHLAVTLLEGRVEVASAQRGAVAPIEPVVLRPGQQLALELSTGEHKVQGITRERADAWLDHQLVFEAASLTEVVTEANRYLSNPVAIGDPSLEEIHVSGVIRAGSLDSLLGSLEASFPIETRQTPDGPVLIRKIPAGR